MKSYLVIFVSVLIGFSCNKELSENEFSIVNSGEIAEILRMGNNYNAVLAFQVLSPEDMAKLWKAKLSYHIKSEKLKYDQRMHLEKLFDKIDPLLYSNDKRSQSKKEEFVMFQEDWISDGLNLFDKEQLFIIAFQIVENESIEQNLTESGKCKCATSSWAACYFGMHGECVSHPCPETKAGFGIIGFTGCDGVCDGMLPG